MAPEVQITFRGLAASPSTEAQVRHKVDELQQFSDRISACRVTLETGHRHHRHGNVYQVRVDLAVPGGKIVVNRDLGIFAQEKWTSGHWTLMGGVRYDSFANSFPAQSLGPTLARLAKRSSRSAIVRAFMVPL